jgi:PEP-CTERM motif
MSSLRLSLWTAAVSILAASPAFADPYAFSTGNPDGKIATASRPDSTGKTEIETADDFVLDQSTTITGATFTGLLTGGVAAPTIGDVVVEIYRVFPLDSDVSRTSGAPTFGTSQVPTRVNSPSDIAFTSRSASAVGELTFTTSVLASSFTVANSVTSGGIHPLPNPFTGGNGPLTGQEVRFDITFASALNLPADHYFFVPQVQVTGGDFYWLSTPKPIVAPGTPFASDLQSWTRDAALDPDWLRVGTDITHQGPFNAAFSLTGTVVAVPEPESYALMLAGFAALGVWARSRRKEGT